jgi:hypothetical protein
MRVLQLDDTVDRLRRENVKPLMTKNQPPTTATEPPPSEIQTPPETKTLGNTEWENQPPTTAMELPPTESQTPPENEVVATTQWETLESDLGSNKGSVSAPPSSKHVTAS